MAYRLRFGSYDFPATMRPAGESSDFDTAAQSLPRRAGARTQTPRRTPTSLVVRGELTGATAADLATAHQALKAAVFAGKADLWYGTDAAFFKGASLRSFSTDYKDGITFGVLANYSITFEAADYPEAFDATTTTTAVSTGSSTLTPGGDAETLPIWSFTLSSAGAGEIQLANAATGETLRIIVPSGATSGQVITVNRDTGVATLAGVSTPSLLRGRIPALRGGVANNLTLTLTTVTISAASVDYQSRWK
jgi:hypothetical protein